MRTANKGGLSSSSSSFFAPFVEPVEGRCKRKAAKWKPWQKTGAQPFTFLPFIFLFCFVFPFPTYVLRYVFGGYNKLLPSAVFALVWSRDRKLERVRGRVVEPLTASLPQLKNEINQLSVNVADRTHSFGSDGGGAIVPHITCYKRVEL